MDAVVVSVIISIAGCILIIGYLAYRFFKIIGSKDDSE
jgi:hypothetical protein